MKCYSVGEVKKLFEPYCLDNTRQGWKAFNNVQYCVRALPQFAQDLHAATRQLQQTASFDTTGRKLFQEKEVRNLLRQWKRACKHLRLIHSYYDPKRKECIDLVRDRESYATERQELEVYFKNQAAKREAEINSYLAQTLK